MKFQPGIGNPRPLASPCPKCGYHEGYAAPLGKHWRVHCAGCHAVLGRQALTRATCAKLALAAMLVALVGLVLLIALTGTDYH